MDMNSRVIDRVESLKDLVGQEVGVSDWLDVTQTMVDDFARTTGDVQWIHVDPDRARRESPFGTTVAHGFLTLALLSRLHAQAVQIQGGLRLAVNYGLNRVRFPAPVPTGSRIRARSTLKAFEDVAGGCQLAWSVIVEIEGGTKPALVAEWLVRYLA
jgi:acyl dehydratase